MSIAVDEAMQDTLRRLSAGRRERYQKVVFTAHLVPESPFSVAVRSPDGELVGHLPQAAVDAHYKTLLEFGRYGRPCCLAELKGGPSSARGFEVVIDVSSLHVG